MTNPYGGGYHPYEPKSNAYDGPVAGLPGDRPLDGISVAALVCSLTCCAAPVGIGLGIGGLLRTREGRRSGRWAAVAGLVLGIVVMVGGIVFFAFAAVMGSRTVWPDEARVGQCIDVDFLGDPIKATCSEPHAGEVIWAGALDGELVESLKDADTDAEFCAGLLGLDEVYRQAIKDGDYNVRIEMRSSDEDDPESGDDFFCYVVSEGEKIEGRLGDAGSGESA